MKISGSWSASWFIIRSITAKTIMCHQHHWPSTNPQWESQRPRNNCNLHDISSLIHLLPSPPLELFKQNQTQKHILSIFTTFDFTILINKNTFRQPISRYKSCLWSHLEATSKPWIFFFYHQGRHPIRMCDGALDGREVLGIVFWVEGKFFFFFFYYPPWN